MEKKAWLAEYRNNKRKAAQLEKQTLKYLPRSQMRGVLQDLENMQSAYITKTWEEENRLYEGIGKLRKDVRRLGGVVSHLGSTPSQMQIETVHQKVKGIEQTLKTFKTRSRGAYESQAQEEEKLSTELNLLLQRFEANHVLEERKSKPPMQRMRAASARRPPPGKKVE